MAAGLEQDLQELQTLAARARKAAELIAHLREKLHESRLREEDLRRQLQQADRDLEQARTDIRFLRVSHRLAASPGALVEARRMISSLIRNIDRAIADLKE